MSVYQLLEKIDEVKQKLTDNEYKSICENMGKIFNKIKKQKPEFTPHEITYLIPSLENVSLSQTEGKLFGTVSMKKCSFVHPYVKIDPSIPHPLQVGKKLFFPNRKPAITVGHHFLSKKDLVSSYIVDTEDHTGIETINSQVFILEVEPYSP